MQEESRDTRNNLRQKQIATGLVQSTDLPDNPGQVIPRVAKTAKHWEFLEANPYADVVMITIQAARRLVEEGETARSAFGDTLVIVSTTIPDKVLEQWYPEREIWVIRAFQPDFYIPCDRPVYKEDSEGKRRDIISRYLDDLERIANALEEKRIEILPLVKGETPSERQKCYDRFERLGYDRYGYYCAQYFLYGYRGGQLVSDIHSIARESEATSLFLVGLKSEKLLWRMPVEVTATATGKWWDECELRETNRNMSEIQKQYGQWKNRLESTLSGGQSSLGQFISGAQTEVTHGE